MMDSTTSTPAAALATAVTAATAAAAALTLLWTSSQPAPPVYDPKTMQKWQDEVYAAEETFLSFDDTDSDAMLWEQSLEDALPAIVSIRIMIVASFDGDAPACTVATGFIVDKVRGLILTNRHVVTPGPVVADATFLNHEEVDLIPVYRDPVHDFGFFRFDPTHVKHMPLHEIPLRPDLATVGTAIRVVGNDNAEKVQVLPGILAKLDRAAPNYGPTGYNDFNTFYYSAASSTSGGSSGSPVLNVDGAAVALNAGGATNAASSYYLPLDRVQRALMLLQADAPVPRGTWQTIFRHVAYDEGRQLGLTTDVEETLRALFPDGMGVLVVDQVVPRGPGDTSDLQVGDLVVQVQDTYMTTFLPLEALLDANVGQSLSLTVLRGGRTVHLALHVQDLHAITPRRYFQLGGCTLHDLSYQQARNASLPVGSVYVASAGHMFVQANIRAPSLVVSCAGQPTPTLDAFIALIGALPHGARVPIQFVLPSNRHVTHCGVVAIDRRWFPTQVVERNDADGVWHATSLPPLLDPPSPTTTATADLPPPPLASDAPWATTLLASMVYVRVDLPVMVDGIVWSSFDGIGYVVDAAHGYVLVDKATVHVGLGTVVLTIAATLEVPATIRFLHPLYNVAIVQYDVGGVPHGAVASLPLATMSSAVSVGDVLEFVGLTRAWSVVAQPSKVTKIDRLALPLFQSPHYRATNVQVWSFDQLNAALGGVFVDKAGHAVALWLKFSLGYANDHSPQVAQYGLPVHLVHDVVAWCRRDAPLPTTVSLLPVEFTTTKVATARAGLGLSAEWTHSLEQRYRDTRQVLTVQRCTAGTQAASVLTSGDLLLSINGAVVAKDEDVAAACANQTAVHMTVLRNKQQVNLTIDVVPFSAMGTTRLIRWCGLVVQAPPLAVLQWGFALPGVYISQIYAGTPADNHGVFTQRFLTQVNDVPTPTLEEFEAVVRCLRHGESARLKTISLNTRVRMFTMKMEYHYNPTVEYVWDAHTGEWTRTTWVHETV
ncbi:Aste57867_25366 [Aphanomyces stellatus]|uniref:Pro-apoptotic serine protease NMA111 n=1 Tax=Aphanomyces stellatus TaxID=120398 RepID=A0A485LT24_9STRA|nr:hypothetical protein As57867_025288 [Aphanomyces stellatus]VFU01991.1 Aste57867_25366 [Aphanomyces stellatus]